MTSTPPKDEIKLDEVETLIQQVNNRIEERENEIKALHDLINKDKELIKKLQGEKKVKDEKEQKDKATADRIRLLLQQTNLKIDSLGKTVADTKTLIETPPK